MIVVYMPNMSRDFLQETYPDFCVFSLLNLGPFFAAVSLLRDDTHSIAFFVLWTFSNHSLSRPSWHVYACMLSPPAWWIYLVLLCPFSRSLIQPSYWWISLVPRCGQSLARSLDHHPDGFVLTPSFAWHPLSLLCSAPPLCSLLSLCCCWLCSAIIDKSQT